MSWLSKLKLGLTKTSAKIASGLDDILNKRKLDEDTAQELEELLISADLGVKLSQEIIKDLLEKFRFNKNATVIEIKESLAHIITNILTPVASKEIVFNTKPKILLLCGVNGNGKTTSIAKLANYYSNEGKKVLLAACDTFRAAAVDQLEVWAKRLQLNLVTGEINSDPASVAFNATKQALNEQADLLMIDTAGRLHNKENLMAELSKIIRSIQKVDSGLDIEVILVLDATTGQNALLQLEKFREITPINWIIITKLDGTAKAGIIVSLAQKFSTPVLAIGVGEKIDDLRPFNASDFAKALLGL